MSLPDCRFMKVDSGSSFNNLQHHWETESESEEKRTITNEFTKDSCAQ